jgi:hypothetical protein
MKTKRWHAGPSFLTVITVNVLITFSSILHVNTTKILDSEFMDVQVRTENYTLRILKLIILPFLRSPPLLFSRLQIYSACKWMHKIRMFILGLGFILEILTQLPFQHLYLNIWAAFLVHKKRWSFVLPQPVFSLGSINGSSIIFITQSNNLNFLKLFNYVSADLRVNPANYLSKPHPSNLYISLRHKLPSVLRFFYYR